jgi:hypothetical protein
MNTEKNKSEWKFVGKKSSKFNLKFWINNLLFRIENDNFKIDEFINLKSEHL